MTKQEASLPKNFGFIPPPSFEEEPKQYLAGADQGIPYFIRKEDGNWRNVKITGEAQSFKLFDSMGCVSNSFTNSVNKQLELLRKDGVVVTKEVSDWLKAKGVILPVGTYEIDEEKIKPWLDDNGKFNTSNRFLAKVSNTTRGGNSPMPVGDAADNFGLPPEFVWSIKQFIANSFDWDEYYKTPLADVYEWGKKFNELFYLRYHRLPDTQLATFRKFSKQAPIWWATATCPGWMSSDLVKACTNQPNHMTLGQEFPADYMGDYDSYNPFDKKLALDYPIYYPYQVIVFPKLGVLKKKELPQNEEESENMKFYKASQNLNPERIYQFGVDGLYHHLKTAPIFTGLYGKFEDNEIIDLKVISDDKIGFTVYDKQSLLDLILNLFKGLKGDNNMIGKLIKRYPKLGSVDDATRLSRSVTGAIIGSAATIIAVFGFFGVRVEINDITSLANLIPTVVDACLAIYGAILTAYGIIRKIIVAIENRVK